MDIHHTGTRVDPIQKNNLVESSSQFNPNKKPANKTWNRAKSPNKNEIIHFKCREKGHKSFKLKNPKKENKADCALIKHNHDLSSDENDDYIFANFGTEYFESESRYKIFSP